MKTISHQGQSTGCRAMMVGFKDTNFVCAILVNNETVNFHKMAFRIHDYFHPPPSPAAHDN